MKYIRVITGVLGLILVVFGIVWLTAVFSRFEKIPSDWDQTDDLQGTFTFVDETFLGRLQMNETLSPFLTAPPGQSPLDDPQVQAILADQSFLTRLQGNATISQLLSSPGSQGLLTDPAIQGILSNPAVAQLASNPELLAIAQDPQALEALSDPTLLSLLSNPDVLGLLQDPVFLAALDPAVIALLQDPAFQTLLGSGALVILASQPQILELLGDPVVIATLANPTVQGLIADPEAFSLVLDSRTQLLLTNAAILGLLADPEALSLVFDPRTQTLLANPADLPTVTVPVLLHRVRRATDTDGDRIFINEQVETLDPTTRQEVPGFPKTDVDLIVDRKSKEYLSGTEGGRSGFWGLPFHVDKDRSYNSWVTAAQRPLEAKYKGTEELQGLETYLFVVDVTDFSLGEADPVTGLPLVLDALITTWNEPKTGSSVKIEDFDSISAMDPLGNKYPRFVADVNHTEETVKDLVAEAKDNRSKIVVFGTYLPWVSIAVGILLGLVAAVMSLASRATGVGVEDSSS